MRGWSYLFHLPCRTRTVIPANAGVILDMSGILQSMNGYPRECGGDPVPINFEMDDNRLSPRMRGWSWICQVFCRVWTVIPANAGVILIVNSTWIVPKSYPRECGGDPDKCIFQIFQTKLSPRMRGWSCIYKLFPVSTKVIPANAGVILNQVRDDMNSMCYPRECGGDPQLFDRYLFLRTLSPRMRGWSCASWLIRTT